MSAAATAMTRRAPANVIVLERSWRLPVAALLAFAASALLSALRYGALLAHAPTLRVLAIVGVTTIMGAALALSASLPRRLGIATGSRIVLVVLASYLSLRLAGISARRLMPWRWPGLAHQLGHGLSALNGLWPYDGGSANARTAVLSGLVAGLILAAALVFWPSEQPTLGRRVGGPAVLLALYLTAAVNQRQIGWQLQGVLLLALLCLWGWSWWPRLHERARALAWLASGTLLALIGAGLVHSPRALIDWHAWNPFGQVFAAQRFDWNQTYGPRTWPNSEETMVEVSSASPELWRASVLDRFDGVRFLRSSAPPVGTSGLDGAVPDRRWVRRASYTIRGLSSEELLSPGAALALSSPSAELRHSARIAGDGTAELRGPPPQSGVSYTVSAYVPQPSVAAMRAAPRRVPAAYLPYTELELPGAPPSASPLLADQAAGALRIASSPYAGVLALAHRLAAGAPSRYDLARRIEAYLRSGFSYDEHPRRRAYPLVAFLLQDRRGYCQQFSGAMALLLRMDGIPARVAAGFQAGTRERDGRFLISARDAHSWVEVYFTGIGWVAFDPTPAAGASGEAGAGTIVRPQDLAGTFAAQRQDARARRAHRHSTKRATPLAGGAAHGGSGPAQVPFFAALVLALILIASLSRSILRRRRSQSAAHQGELTELVGAMRATGIEIGSATTLAELETRLAASHGRAAARYVRLLRDRRYASDADPQRPNTRDRRLLRHALCARRGPLVRLRTLLALPPVAPWQGRRGVSIAQRDT